MAEIIAHSLLTALGYAVGVTFGIVVIIDTVILCSKVLRFMVSLVMSHVGHLRRELAEWRAPAKGAQ